MKILIFLMTAFLSACSTSTTNNSATNQVKNFYTYYISTFSTAEPNYQDPKLQHYISATTLNRLHHIMDMPEQEIVTADYFTYTQDYDPAWLAELKIRESHNIQHDKIIDVYLGIENGKHKHLKVYLKQESGIWKIFRVQDASNRYEQKMFDNVVK